jgi:hypothetical protein
MRAHAQLEPCRDQFVCLRMIKRKQNHSNLNNESLGDMRSSQLKLFSNDGKQPARDKFRISFSRREPWHRLLSYAATDISALRTLDGFKYYGKIIRVTRRAGVPRLLAGPSGPRVDRYGTGTLAVSGRAKPATAGRWRRMPHPCGSRWTYDIAAQAPSPRCAGSTPD